MKYKLIKSYPNSRETGTIVSPVLQPDTGSKTSRYIDSSGRYYGWHEVEDYPEYWEAVKEPQFKVGDWIYYIGTKKDNHGINTEYWYPGRVSKFYRYDDDADRNTCSSLYVNDEEGSNAKDAFRLATPEEIETHLIAEAKKRGYTGKILAKTGINKVFGQPFAPILGFKYFPLTDTLDSSGGNGLVYQQDQWAEIVKEEEIKIGEYEVKFRDGEISIGCKRYTFAEVKELYNICLTFGVSQIYVHNHLVEYITLKRIYDRLK